MTRLRTLPTDERVRGLGIVAIAAVLAVVVTSIGAPIRIDPDYEGLLPVVLSDIPDPVFGDRVDDYALIHAMVLMAAESRGDVETATGMVARLRAAELPTGWGMPWEWDAFGDGSVNPTSTAYALTTGLVIHALLDAGEPVELRIAEDWSTRLDWYSDRRSDAIWTPSAAAIIASAAARMGYLTEAQTIFDRLGVGRFAWQYSDRQPIVNDLTNYVYILWGGELARDAGVDVPWTRGEALASLGRYGGVYPTDVELSEDMIRRLDGPWEVSGAGAALALVSMYGSVGTWRTRTVDALVESRVLPRFAVHALLGLTLADHRVPD